MKQASLGVAAALLLTASPAFATQALECSSPGRRGFAMIVSVGSSNNVDYVRIMDGRRELVTAYPGYPRIGRGVLTNAGRLNVTLVGRDRRTPVAVIATQRSRRAHVGTLRYRGQTLRIRCQWEPQE